MLLLTRTFRQPLLFLVQEFQSAPAIAHTALKYSLCAIKYNEDFRVSNSVEDTRALSA